MVCGDADQLGVAVAAKLAARGIPARRVRPEALGNLSITLANDVFTVDGSAVGGVLFRAFPDSHFGARYGVEDWTFCNAEIGATWLAALHLESVLAINRYTAAAWYEGLGWPVWRRALMGAGIPVAPFTFGDTSGDAEWSWYPFATGLPETPPPEATRRVLGAAHTTSTPAQRSVVAAAAIVAGEATATVIAAARALAAHGLSLAEIVTDSRGRVLSVDPQPDVIDDAFARTADALVEVYGAHLRRW